MAKRNLIDVQELSDEGYIGEANRRFFHPLGLALERSTGWEEADVEQVMTEWLGRAPSPNQLSGAMVFIEAAGLAGPHLTGVWDDRDDPEGVRYGGDYTDLIRAAAAHIDALWAEREPARRAALGYMVQPP